MATRSEGICKVIVKGRPRRFTGNVSGWIFDVGITMKEWETGLRFMAGFIGVIGTFAFAPYPPGPSYRQIVVVSIFAIIGAIAMIQQAFIGRTCLRIAATAIALLLLVVLGGLWWRYAFTY